MRHVSTDQAAKGATITTDIPARLDRLPWCRFHVLIVFALGITWILDGLEVTIVGSIGPVLQNTATLGLSVQQVGEAASSYVVGAVGGALVFGWLTDRFGRRFVFYVTLIVYLTGVMLTALSWNFWSFAAFRAVIGLGIGGEYAAINSAIDELIPAKYRGRVDLIVNGSFWLGAALGSGASLLFLDPKLFAIDFGWRFGFAVGGVLGLGILLLRRFVPESPRWLVTHGRTRQADAAVAEIEARVQSDTGVDLAPVRETLTVRPRKSFGLGLILHAMLHQYRERSILAAVLLTAQAFLFNAVFFSYGLVLTTFHGVPEQSTGLYLLPLAVSNFLGPVLLSPLFDIVGRRVMIAGTYAAAGVLLLLTAVLLGFDVFTAWTPDDCLDGDLLFRLRGGELRLPDRERDLSAGGAGAGNRDILRDRHRGRRRRRPGAIRLSYRIRRYCRGCLGLCHRCGADADRGCRRGQVRRRRGTEVVGEHCAAIVRRVRSVPVVSRGTRTQQ
jgi:MFS family permease